MEDTLPFLVLQPLIILVALLQVQNIWQLTSLSLYMFDMISKSDFNCIMHASSKFPPTAVAEPMSSDYARNLIKQFVFFKTEVFNGFIGIWAQLLCKMFSFPSSINIQSNLSNYQTYIVARIFTRLQWKPFWRHVLEVLLILAGLLSTAGINHLQLLVGVVSLSNGWFFFFLNMCSMKAPGVLGPLSGFTFVIVSQQEEGSEERLFWCQVMALQRNLINASYFQTFFFNCVWRVVHIRFADRGLVVGGKPNIRLLGHLYWITFATFLTIFYFGFPLQKILAGTLQQTNAGRVCLGQRWLNLTSNTKNCQRHNGPRVLTLYYRQNCLS